MFGMPLQNVVQNASLRVPRVIEHAPMDASLEVTYMENNRDIFHSGNMAVSERMFAARDPISNFGTETHIGKGASSRASREIMETSVENIAKIMERDDEFEGSQMGDYSPLGSMGVIELNDRSFEKQQQIVARAYEYFGNYGI